MTTHTRKLHEQILPDGSHFGNYTIVRLLGRGGMGEVYLVEDPVANEMLAVKILDPRTVDSAEEWRELESRFVREAEFAMSIDHPNMLRVYDVGKDPETSLAYMTMEYMPRGSLAKAIAESGPLEFSRIPSIVADVASALFAIEENGMVHRDVKSANIMMAADGQAKLADFGISRFDSKKAAQDEINVTRAEAVVGTPAYMAPEQMLDSRTVDIRADIYSLGVVMFEMMTGHRPNEGESPMATLAKALDGRLPPDARSIRPDVPAALAMLARAMMLPNAASRPQSAHDVIALLAHPGKVSRYLPDATLAVNTTPWYEDRGIIYALVALVFSLEALVAAAISVFMRR